jgi:hypothetical protein
VSTLIATPVISAPRDDVLQSWDYWAHVIVVNGAHEAWANCEHDNITWRLVQDENRGVSWSWNRAFEFASRNDFEFVTLLSQNCVLAEGTSGLAAQIEHHADWRGLLTDQAWHVLTLSVALWQRIGPFDEGFVSYYEDSDYTRRLYLAGLHTPENRMPKVDLDCTCEFAATMKAGLISPDVYQHSRARYMKKWHGEPFHERLTIPWDEHSWSQTNNWSCAEARA